MKTKLTLKKPSKRIFHNNDTEMPQNEDKPVQAITRSRKRVIKRADISRDKLTRTKPQVAQPKKKPKAAKKPQPIRKPVKSPSDLRAEELNASLNAFEVWLNYRPLALGIEKQLFQHINKHSFSSSKRVVQKLLRKHTHHGRYLQAVGVGGKRFNLDGTEAGDILQHEREYAGQVLAGRER